MRRIFLFLLSLVFTFNLVAENIFTNGNMDKVLNYVPLAKIVKEKNFDVKAPWPAGFLIDSGSKPCAMSFTSEPTKALLIENNGIGTSTVYSAAEFKPAKYKLRFSADGITANSSVRIILYCYNAEKKWAGAMSLHQYKLEEKRPVWVSDFTVNKAGVASFRIAFACNGKVKLSNISLTEIKK